MNDIMKIVKYLEQSGLLRSYGKNKKWSNKQKGGFLGKLFNSLGARLLGNLLTGKSTIRAAQDF